MGPRVNPRESVSGVEQVRARLLTALHLGQSKPGDRAPSIRRMAALTRLNHKTVHRAYSRLAEEGLLDVKWGSGTFFSETRRPATNNDPLPSSLLEAVERYRVEANHLGIAADVFLRFLGLTVGGQLRGTPIVVAECNLEQIGLIGRELRAALGVDTRQLLITESVAQHPSLFSDVRGIVTTDCHRQEVTEMASPLGIPVYRVALAPAFTQTLIQSARRGPVLMVVRDPSYGPVFLRMLRQMSIPREVVERFKIIGSRELSSDGVRQGSGAVYLSPLVAAEVDRSLVRGLRRLRPPRYLATASVETVKVHLALELATHGEQTDGLTGR